MSVSLWKQRKETNTDRLPSVPWCCPWWLHLMAGFISTGAAALCWMKHLLLCGVHWLQTEHDSIYLQNNVLKETSSWYYCRFLRFFFSNFLCFQVTDATLELLFCIAESLSQLKLVQCAVVCKCWIQLECYLELSSSFQHTSGKLLS